MRIRPPPATHARGHHCNHYGQWPYCRRDRQWICVVSCVVTVGAVFGENWNRGELGGDRPTDRRYRVELPLRKLEASGGYEGRYHSERELGTEGRYSRTVYRQWCCVSKHPTSRGPAAVPDADGQMCIWGCEQNSDGVQAGPLRKEETRCVERNETRTESLTHTQFSVHSSS